MQFTKFAVGSGTLTDISTITSLTELVTPVKNFNITKIDKETSTQVKVKGLFKNTDVTEGFYLREIGLYAKDLETEAEILFAYINYGENAEFVNNTVDAKTEFYYDLDIVVGNAENIEIVVNSEASYVTDKDLEELKEKYYKEIISEEKSIITLPWYYKVGANMLRVLHEGQELEEATSFTGLDGYWLPITEKDVIAEEGTWTNKIQCNEGWTWLPGVICKVYGRGVMENDPSSTTSNANSGNDTNNEGAE